MRRVTILKKYNHPVIESIVHDDEKSLSVSLDDFVAALKTEIGSVSFIFRNATFGKKLDMAVENIINNIKEESKRTLALM